MSPLCVGRVRVCDALDSCQRASRADTAASIRGPHDVESFALVDGRRRWTCRDCGRALALGRACSAGSEATAASATRARRRLTPTPKRTTLKAQDIANPEN